MVAATTRVSTRMVRLSPTRSNSLLLQDAQQLDLQLGAHAGDFVEEDRAAVGRLEAAGLVVDGAGERPLDVAEQLALQQALAEGAAVDADVGAVGARAEAVDGRAISSLPVPVSPTSRTLAGSAPPAG